VLATDLSPTILEYAARDARAAGLANVATRELDGEALAALPAGGFDAVISRLGVIYFPDRAAALAGMRQVLAPGGRVGLVVYSTPDRNGFFSLPVSIIRRRAQLPPPLPGQPGPFSLGTDGALAAALEGAGFRDVIVEAVDASVRLPSAADCVRFERESFGALHQMMSKLSAEEQADTWTEIADALARYEGPAGFVGPGELLVAAAAR
jgi:SAM-dependent methyltransferase